MDSVDTRLPRLSTLLAAQVRYQMTLMLRSAPTYLLSLVFPAIMLTILLKARTHGSQAAVMAEHLADISGILVFGALTIAYVAYTTTLVSAREQGVLRRWHLAPLPAWVYFTGRIITCVLLADCAGIILLAVGAIMADVHVSAEGVIRVLVVETLGALALAAAATAITTVVKTTQSLGPVLVLTYMPLLIFSDGIGKLALPQWVNTLMGYLPVKPVIQSVSAALQPSSGGVALMSLHDAVVLAAWAVCCLIVSVRFFRWDPSRPRHARYTDAGASARAAT